VNRPQPISVLLATEGTYPFYTGGVSTWCHRLTYGLPYINFDVLAVVTNPFQQPKYELAPNVQEVIKVPQWGLLQPARLVDLTGELMVGNRSAARLRVSPQNMPVVQYPHAVTIPVALEADLDRARLEAIEDMRGGGHLPLMLTVYPVLFEATGETRPPVGSHERSKVLLGRFRFRNNALAVAPAVTASSPTPSRCITSRSEMSGDAQITSAQAAARFCRSVSSGARFV